MRFFHNVYDDLLERRLLPLAVLLILALVAVPLVLSKSMPGTAAVAASGPAPELDVPSAVPAVALSSPDTSGRLDHLKALNPFEQRHKPKLKSPVTVAAAAAVAATPARPSGSASPIAAAGSSVGTPSSTPPSTAPSASAPSASAPGGPSGSPAPAPHVPGRRYLVAGLQVRFGPIGQTGPTQGLDRLAPLPRSGSPAVVYLGLLRDHKTAVFLVSSDVKAEGDGRCLPSPRDCQTVRLRAGDTEFFDQTNSHGGVTSYQLDVVRVASNRMATASAARRANARVSRRGQKLTRESRTFRARAAAARSLRYDERTGVLVARRPR